MLHQGHVRLSLPENSIANLRAQIVWHCHPQTKTHLHMVHSHAPRLGSGMAFTTFCGITCDREGKGWEGVGVKGGVWWSRSSVASTCCHLPLKLWVGRWVGGLYSSCSKHSEITSWAAAFLSIARTKETHGRRRLWIVSMTFPSHKSYKGGSRFPILAGYLSYMWHISNPIPFCLPIKFCSPFWQAKNMPDLS